MAVNLRGVCTVLLPGTGSDDDYVYRAFSAALHAIGAVVAASVPQSSGLIGGYVADMDNAAREAPIAVGGVSIGAAVAAAWALLHPGHAVARRQMTGGFGGMLSIRVKGGEAAAIATAARVEIWKRATSLGGVESLMEHRASIEGAGTPVPADLLRLSVGIEDPQDLIDDLDAALSG